MLNISQVILVRTDSNLCRKELTVHWSTPNSLIRFYLQPCTNSKWGDESEAVAPIIWLYQTVDARKEEVFFPDILITLRRHGCHYLVTAYFFWIENIPQDISCDTRDVLVQYINSVIKTDIPDESDVELYQLVKWLQTHSHSKYLKKTPPSSGRFKFPFVLQTI